MDLNQQSYQFLDYVSFYFFQEPMYAGCELRQKIDLKKTNNLLISCQQSNNW